MATSLVGGTTDFAIFGAKPRQTGVVAVGGDHSPRHCRGIENRRFPTRKKQRLRLALSAMVYETRRGGSRVGGGVPGIRFAFVGDPPPRAEEIFPFFVTKSAARG